jgi:hypothetical protein
MKTIRCVIKFIGYAIIMTIPITDLDPSNGPQTDENGMYKDVNVIDINSDTPNDTVKKNKKNLTADLDQFFKAVWHIKNDKHGQCQCKLCT